MTDHGQLIFRLSRIIEGLRGEVKEHIIEDIQDAAELAAERDVLERRLEYLLKSETIRKYDEYAAGGKTWARNIMELDRRMRYLEEIEKKYYEIAPFIQGEIVYNKNNNSRGVVIEEMKDKAAVRILEVNSKVGVFINCPPRIALERTGEAIDLKQLIMEREG